MGTRDLIFVGFVSAIIFILFFVVSLSDSATDSTTENGHCTQGGCTQPPPDCIIKGNISPSGEKIYHVPGGKYYSRTQIDPSDGERWFCTEHEAESNGWRRSKV